VPALIEPAFTFLGLTLPCRDDRNSLLESLPSDAQDSIASHEVSSPSADISVHSNLAPGFPLPGLGCALRFSQPLGAFLRARHSGLVSSRCRSWGFPLQGFFLLRSDTLPSGRHLPPWRSARAFCVSGDWVPIDAALFGNQRPNYQIPPGTPRCRTSTSRPFATEQFDTQTRRFRPCWAAALLRFLRFRVSTSQSPWPPASRRPPPSSFSRNAFWLTFRSLLGVSIGDGREPTLSSGPSPRAIPRLVVFPKALVTQELWTIVSPRLAIHVAAI
jgi:hypothetical protein